MAVYNFKTGEQIKTDLTEDVKLEFRNIIPVDVNSSTFATPILNMIPTGELCFVEGKLHQLYVATNGSSGEWRMIKDISENKNFKNAKVAK